MDAPIAETHRLKADIDDCVLKAPLSGRVLYRLAEPGEVLAAGGKILTILDLTDVYMTIFLPTQEAGRIALRADARILLDAIPDIAIPATVSYVAAKAQFTPKEVETRTEREKLMFRVKLKIDPELLKRHEPLVKTGLPGVAYVRLDADADWPAQVLARRTL
jgi:HlyD family secretion protein